MPSPKSEKNFRQFWIVLLEKIKKKMGFFKKKIENGLRHKAETWPELY